MGRADIVVALAGVVGCFSVASSFAASQRPSEVVRWSAAGPSGTAKAGSEVRLRLTAEIEAGWHLYASTQPKGGPEPLAFKSVPGQPLELLAARIDAPLPRLERDDNFGLETQFYDETATFGVPVKLLATAPPGKQALSVDVRFQACSKRLCLRPATERVPVEITIAARGRSGKE